MFFLSMYKDIFSLIIAEAVSDQFYKSELLFKLLKIYKIAFLLSVRGEKTCEAGSADDYRVKKHELNFYAKLHIIIFFEHSISSNFSRLFLNKTYKFFQALVIKL